MLRVKNSYLNFMEVINKIVKYILAVFLSIMVIVIFAQVFSRFILNDSILWSEELSRYLMIWGVFLGTGYATKKDLLIAVKILPEFLPEKPKKVVYYMIQILMIIFGILLFYIGGGMTLNVINQVSPSLSVSMAFPYAAIPVGGLLITLNSIVLLLQRSEKEREIE